jgi:Rod binding domain-containing protein
MGTSSGTGSLGATSNLLQLQSARVVQKGAIVKSQTDDAKIDKSSQQFEAILVGTWLNEAQQSFASVPGGDTDRDVGGDQMMSLGVQSLSTSIASSGGLGIGKMIAKAMHAAADKEKVHVSAVGSTATPREVEDAIKKSSS